MLTENYLYQDEIPDVGEYVALRLACGLSARSHVAAERGLPGSLFSTTIRYKRRLIAMARIVGDGGCNYQVVDVAVHPDHQREGLGTALMTSVMAYLEDHAPDSAYVSLIADHHSPALYTRFGFKSTAPVSIGMAYIVNEQSA